MFKVYDPSNSETLVSKLFLNFSVVNTTQEAVHVQFLMRTLVFTIIPTAREGSINMHFDETAVPRHPREEHILLVYLFAL